MNLVENITKIEHKKYGVGTLVNKDSNMFITVSFPKIGNKKFSISSFKEGILKIVEESVSVKEKEIFNENSDDIIQFDSASMQMGNRNVIEAMVSNNNLVFNESYTIIGNKTCANSIYACYNLTVLGDLCVEKIEVKGSLTVLGKIKAKEIVCENFLFCNGKIESDRIDIGRDLISESIKCSELLCGGNVIVQTTIDVENTEIDKTIIAGEGIIGGGVFSAQNAVAVEYFEYDGEIKGKVFELEEELSAEESTTDTYIIDKEITYDDLLNKIRDVIEKDVNEAGSKSEDDLLEVAKRISESDVLNTSDWLNVFANVIDISYFDKIENFRDYLVLFYASKILPVEMINYETVEHLFQSPLREAKENGLELPLQYKSVDDFLLCLKIANLYWNELGYDKDELMDKIFQAIGLKYVTVKSFFTKK